jgi:hypothetical protein
MAWLAGQRCGLFHRFVGSSPFKIYREDAGIVASIALTLSGAYLVVNVRFGSIDEQRSGKAHRNGYKEGSKNATPIEKCVLEAVIHKGEYLIRLDVGARLRSTSSRSASK